MLWCDYSNLKCTSCQTAPDVVLFHSQKSGRVFLIASVFYSLSCGWLVYFHNEENPSFWTHLWSSASVDVHTDGAVGSTATHKQMSSVVRLHHTDKIPTAVLESETKNKKSPTRKHFLQLSKLKKGIYYEGNTQPWFQNMRN